MEKRRSGELDMLYVSATYSVSMLAKDAGALVLPRSFGWAAQEIQREPFKSVVGHADSAKWFSLLLDRNVEYNREIVELLPGDRLIAIVPQFRAETAREFTIEEIAAAEWRYFEVQVYEDVYREILPLCDGR